MTTMRYAAAHLVLPTMVFASPARTVERLTGPERQDFLQRTVWGLAALCSRGAIERATRVGARAETLAGRAVVVVRFPTPQDLADAHAAVIVMPRAGWSSRLRGSPPRYFTLESGFDMEKNELGTFIGEWTSTRQHFNYGPGPRASDKDGFLRAVAEVLDGRRAPFASSEVPVDDFLIEKITRAA